MIVRFAGVAAGLHEVTARRCLVRLEAHRSGAGAGNQLHTLSLRRRVHEAKELRVRVVPPALTARARERRYPVAERRRGSLPLRRPLLADLELHEKGLRGKIAGTDGLARERDDIAVFERHRHLQCCGFAR